MVEKRRYDSEEESLNGEAAYVAPSAQESSSDDEVLILPSKRVRAIESDDDDGDDGELEVDSDDPDGEPTKKKKKPKLKSTPPAPALKKPRKPAAAKKEGEATEKKEKKVKPKKDADGKNTRIVKVNTALYPAPETNRQSFIPLLPARLTPYNSQRTPPSSSPPRCNSSRISGNRPTTIETGSKHEIPSTATPSKTGSHSSKLSSPSLPAQTGHFPNFPSKMSSVESIATFDSPRTSGRT